MKFDVVIIGGGLSGCTAAKRLLDEGKSCVVVAEGLSLEGKEARKEYLSLSGLLLPGDAVIGGNRSGSKLEYVKTRNLGETLLEADFFILATGKFFSKGLVATISRIYEPIFGCDVEYEKDRSKWCNPDFYAEQPFESFGVRTDEHSRVYIGGEVMNNLYAVGEILSGKCDIRESALKVAEEICRRQI